MHSIVFISNYISNRFHFETIWFWNSVCTDWTVYIFIMGDFSKNSWPKVVIRITIVIYYSRSSIDDDDPFEKKKLPIDRTMRINSQSQSISIRLFFSHGKQSNQASIILQVNKQIFLVALANCQEHMVSFKFILPQT